MADGKVVPLPVIRRERDAEQEADVLDALADIFPPVELDSFQHFLAELKWCGFRIVRVVV